MKQNTMCPNLIQKFIPDEELKPFIDGIRWSYFCITILIMTGEVCLNLANQHA
ncbi:hypothetical protein [Bacillus sp. FJAT-52991]|uniref:Uncharacterized protein n=1 Tax=Bacillus kandeliae TaxID=3129297 RepID=A0ABZ2N6V5_9BACI